MDTASHFCIGVGFDKIDRIDLSGFMHTLAFAFRTRGHDQLCDGMVFPLDDGVRGERWVLSLGYRPVMR